MFAILLTPENMPTIRERHSIPNNEETETTFDLFNRAKREYYVVVGYVTMSGRVKDYAILPAYVFEATFDFDSKKIRNDWDQVVRKH